MIKNNSFWNSFHLFKRGCDWWLQTTNQTWKNTRLPSLLLATVTFKEPKKKKKQYNEKCMKREEWAPQIGVSRPVVKRGIAGHFVYFFQRGNLQQRGEHYSHSVCDNGKNLAFHFCCSIWTYSMEKFCPGQWWYVSIKHLKIRAVILNATIVHGHTRVMVINIVNPIG